jgi:hypothetical protein
MTSTQNERLLEAVESIANYLKKIEYWQEHQTDIINGGFGFVRDISSSLDGGLAINNFATSFEDKMSELIDAIDLLINLPTVQEKPSSPQSPNDEGRVL